MYIYIHIRIYIIPKTLILHCAAAPHAAGTAGAAAGAGASQFSAAQIEQAHVRKSAVYSKNNSKKQNGKNCSYTESLIQRVFAKVLSVVKRIVKSKTEEVPLYRECSQKCGLE